MSDPEYHPMGADGYPAVLVPVVAYKAWKRAAGIPIDPDDIYPSQSLWVTHSDLVALGRDPENPFKSSAEPQTVVIKVESAPVRVESLPDRGHTLVRDQTGRATHSVETDAPQEEASKRRVGFDPDRLPE